MASEALTDWLRKHLSDYSFDIAGVASLSDKSPTWPVTFHDSIEVLNWLEGTGQLLALPDEPAALANILEQSIATFLGARAVADGIDVFSRGTDRGYPDLEIQDERFGPKFHAIDIKVARRKYTKRAPTQTQSRITLYTGNTYFKYPLLHWPGTPRPFDAYATHLDVVLIYTFDGDSRNRVLAPEILVHETWRIASKQRSSTTREYIGAVLNLEDLKQGRGEFQSAAEFYTYWRKFPFKVSAQVARQLNRLAQAQGEELARRDAADQAQARNVSGP